jgi:hypothetical protein
MTGRVGAVVLVLMSSIAGCGGLTREEAAAALDESTLSASATGLVGASVELSTNFTIGGAVETAAGELRTFVESQLPCAEVTLSGATLTIVYGARPGACMHRGHTFSGTHEITVLSNQMEEVVVTHRWTDLRDDEISVSGSATVTWSFADATRHVVHELRWTRLSDGQTATGSGDRLQMPLDEGLLTGFAESGSRAWSGESGQWTLDVEGVQMRWVDPCPQRGLYTLDTPFRKTITMSFMRTSSTVINVVLTSGARRYDFDVLTVPTL